MASSRLLCALLLAAPASAQLFPTPVYPTSPDGGIALIVLDLDGDGHLDVAVTDPVGGHVVVQHGDGHGKLATVATLGSATSAIGLSAGDLQGDGLLDLVAARWQANKLAVYTSLGGSSYAAPLLVNAGNEPRDVELADLDGDGDPDAVTANNTLTSTSVLLNVNGTLQSPPVKYGEVYAEDVAVHDLDLDGDLDPVIASTSGTLAWFPNDGSGALGSTQLLDNGTAGVDMVAIADFDENGWPDLAGSASFSDEGLPIFFGQGGGAFTLQHLPLILATKAVTTADLDSDGHADLVFGAPEGMAAVLLGDGAGGFAAHGATHVGTSQAMVVGADLDEDGCADLVAIDFGPGVSVRLGDGFANFPDPHEVPVHWGVDGLRTTDIDLDGVPDIVSVSSGGSLSWLRGQGDGTFTEQLLAGGEGPSDVDAADLDGNGAMDIVAADYDGGQVVVHMGDGSLSFPAPTSIIEYPAGYPLAVTLGDVGAGAAGPDIVLAAYTPDSIGVIGGDGAGGWLPPVLYASGQLPDSPCLADLEPDGDLDVLYVRHGDAVLAALRNNGGVLGAPETWPAGPVGSSPGSLAVGDLDEDGRSDAVVCLNQADAVAVLLGGPGGFQPAVTYPSVVNLPNDVELGDVDGDGHLDVVLAGFGSDAFAVLRGDGLGTLSQAEIYGGIEHVTLLALGDFDLDGRLDVATNEFPVGLSLSLAADVDAGVWRNLGSALAGAAGPPSLAPSGALEPSTPVSLKLTGAAPGSTAALVLGLTALEAPFKGGTLVPSPAAIIAGLPTGPGGSFTAVGTLPAGLPAGTTLYAQYWVVDAGGPKGLAASNAVVGTTP
jgi:hypothetical protein